MMKSFRGILVTLLMVFLQPVWAEPVIYTQDNQTITVTSKEPSFIITLKSNLTTGYSWTVDYDSKWLEKINHYYQAPNSRRMGAPGYEFWTFRATPAAFITPHQTAIKFAYVRPWEHDSHPTEVVFTVATQ